MTATPTTIQTRITDATRARWRLIDQDNVINRIVHDITVLHIDPVEAIERAAERITSRLNRTNAEIAALNDTLADILAP